MRMEVKDWKARAEQAERERDDVRAYNERLIGLVDRWHRDAEFNGTACDEQKKRAEKAERERDALREALKRIANTYDASWGVGNIARAALEAKP